MKHIHHIDGNRNNNSEDNLIEVSPAMHWAIHFQQWEDKGRPQDAKACSLLYKNHKVGKAISGYKDPAHGKLIKEKWDNGEYDDRENNIQKAWDSGNRVYNQRGEKHPMYGKKNPSTKKLLGEYTCVHCGKVSGHLGAHKRWHDDNCKIRTMAGNKMGYEKEIPNVKVFTLILDGTTKVEGTAKQLIEHLLKTL